MKIFLFALLATFTLTSCNKDSDCNYFDAPATAPAVEVTYLRDWLENASIPYIAHPSGAFYTITTEGVGANPQICSNIRIRYTGRLLNGTTFETSTSSGISVILGQLIVGLQKTLPLIKEGGSIIVYVPPYLGFGYDDRLDQNGGVIIPAESYVIFEVDLLNVD